MKEQILNALKQKYKGVSDKFLGLYADKLAAKVTEASQIEGVINELDNLPISITDLAAEFQKEGDRRVAALGKPKPTEKKEEVKKEETPTPDDVPAYMKDFFKKFDDLSGKVAAIQGEKVATTIRGKAAEKLKEVPESFWNKRAIPQSEEEIEAFVTEVTTDFTAFKQDLTDKGLSVLSAPKAGGGGPASGEVAPEVKAFIAKSTPAPAKV